MKPTVANVKKLLPGRRWATWGEFKNALVRAGVLSSFYEECPKPWIQAYLKTFTNRGTKS